LTGNPILNKPAHNTRAALAERTSRPSLGSVVTPLPTGWPAIMGGYCLPFSEPISRYSCTEHGLLFMAIIGRCKSPLSRGWRPAPFSGRRGSGREGNGRTPYRAVSEKPGSLDASTAWRYPQSKGRNVLPRRGRGRFSPVSSVKLLPPANGAAMANRGLRMWRTVVYGIGAVAVLYLAIVIGALMSWRQRALRAGRLPGDFGETPT
jgi:hypothetical protein